MSSAASKGHGYSKGTQNSTASVVLRCCTETVALRAQIDQQRLRAQQEAASAAAAAAAEATREAVERRQRAEEELTAVRAMEEQSRAWLQRKEAELASKLDAAAAAEEAAQQKAQAAAAAAQEQQQELSRSRQQLQAEEESLVHISPDGSHRSILPLHWSYLRWALLHQPACAACM